MAELAPSSVHAESRIIPPTELAEPYFGRLTPREQQVSEMLTAGKSPKVIAKEFDISVDQVRDHISAGSKRLEPLFPQAKPQERLIKVYMLCSMVPPTASRRSSRWPRRDV